MTPTDPDPTLVDPGALILRRALVGEAGLLAAIQIAARLQAPMPAAMHSFDETSSWLAARLAEHEAWVAERGGRVVGYARFTDTWLDDLYVAPAAAGGGVGSALLDLVKSGCPAGFRLWVFAENAPARAFYAARGLVELEHTDGSGNAEGVADLAMAWPGQHPAAFYESLIAAVDADLVDLRARRAALVRAADAHRG